jgi:hypothetical protein
MGMEHRIEFGPAGCPAWSGVADLLADSGFHVDVRMIDGALALPEESPPASWRELRIGTPGGMITVRRTGNAVSVITWENADQAMRGAWLALTWAYAQAGQGLVIYSEGELTAADFRRREKMPFPS